MLRRCPFGIFWYFFFEHLIQHQLFFQNQTRDNLLIPSPEVGRQWSGDEPHASVLIQPWVHCSQRQCLQHPDCFAPASMHGVCCFIATDAVAIAQHPRFSWFMNRIVKRRVKMKWPIRCCVSLLNFFRRMWAALKVLLTFFDFPESSMVCGLIFLCADDMKGAWRFLADNFPTGYNTMSVNNGTQYISHPASSLPKIVECRFFVPNFDFFWPKFQKISKIEKFDPNFDWQPMFESLCYRHRIIFLVRERCSAWRYVRCMHLSWWSPSWPRHMLSALWLVRGALVCGGWLSSKPLYWRTKTWLLFGEGLLWGGADKAKLPGGMVRIFFPGFSTFFLTRKWLNMHGFRAKSGVLGEKHTFSAQK